jgi:hypothetical protein
MADASLNSSSTSVRPRKLGINASVGGFGRYGDVQS